MAGAKQMVQKQTARKQLAHKSAGGPRKAVRNTRAAVLASKGPGKGPLKGVQKKRASSLFSAGEKKARRARPGKVAEREVRKYQVSAE